MSESKYEKKMDPAIREAEDRCWDRIDMHKWDRIIARREIRGYCGDRLTDSVITGMLAEERFRKEHPDMDNVEVCDRLMDINRLMAEAENDRRKAEDALSALRGEANLVASRFTPLFSKEVFDAAIGYWDNRVLGYVPDNAHPVGIEDDFVAVMRFLKPFMSGTGHKVRFLGLTTVLYSKPYFGADFLIDGFDGTFSFIMPVTWERGSAMGERMPVLEDDRYKVNCVASNDWKPLAPRYSYREFDDGFRGHTERMAQDHDPVKLHTAFVTRLNSEEFAKDVDLVGKITEQDCAKAGISLEEARENVRRRIASDRAHREDIRGKYKWDSELEKFFEDHPECVPTP